MALALVTMPFMDSDRPAIQLSLLKSIAVANGFPTRSVYANLEFTARIGPRRYRRLVEHRGFLIGDWLFSLEAFGEAAPDLEDTLLDEFTEHLPFDDDHDHGRQWLRQLRHQVIPEYLDALVDDHPWADWQVVGFSSSFQQNTASIALARRLKARYPDLITLFGGANFDGEMGPELVRTVSCIDLAVVGEGDDALPAVLSALAGGRDPTTVPGVVARTETGIAATAPAPPRTTLDDLPVPDHQEYFETAQRIGFLDSARRARTWIPIETARGCWWGAKHHCVFCGLNATTMQFRSKSPDRVRSELQTLTHACGSFRFAAVDNILDQTYLTSLLPALADEGLGYDLFFEVKSNLGRDQLRMLSQAGVRHIQPGLESLSTPVLRLMDKGVTAAQNVNLLRWCRYYGIDVAWNILWGIPGETAEDQTVQANLVPHLAHLQPPTGASRIWLERFSPLFREPSELFASRSPERSYRYVYPDTMDLDRLAYFFDYELAQTLPETAYEELAQASREWRERWEHGPPPHLEYRWTPGLLQIHDNRRERSGTHTIEGIAADLYVACSDRPRTATAVHRTLKPPITVDQVQETLAEFTRLGLMLLDEDRALALALPATGGR